LNSSRFLRYIPKTGEASNERFQKNNNGGLNG